MRVKEGFVLRKICGETVISPEGMHQINFSKLISLNDTATFLMDKLWGEDFNPDIMADILCDEYEISRETAMNDSKALCDQLIKHGIAE